MLKSPKKILIDTSAREEEKYRCLKKISLMTSLIRRPYKAGKMGNVYGGQYQLIVGIDRWIHDGFVLNQNAQLQRKTFTP